MADKSDASSEEPAAEAAEVCSTCGVRIDPTDWHPVATRVDEDGDFHLYTFCSTDCRTEWEQT